MSRQRENVEMESIEFFCDKCPRKFKKKDNLKTHIQQVHEKQKKQCITCNRMFHPNAIRRHQTICWAKPKKNFRCEKCGKSYSRNEHLNVHHRKKHIGNVQQAEVVIAETKEELEATMMMGWCIDLEEENE